MVWKSKEATIVGIEGMLHHDVNALIVEEEMTHDFLNDSLGMTVSSEPSVHYYWKLRGLEVAEDFPESLVHLRHYKLCSI